MAPFEVEKNKKERTIIHAFGKNNPVNASCVREPILPTLYVPLISSYDKAFSTTGTTKK